MAKIDEGGYRLHELDARAARALGAVLRTLVWVLPPIFALMALAPTTAALELIAVGAIFAAVVLLYHLHRRGLVRLSAYLLVGSLVAFATAGAAAYGSVRAVAAVGYYGAVIAGGMFLGARALAITAVASSACIGALIWLQNAALLPVPHAGVGAHHWFIYSAALGAIGAMIHYARNLLTDMLFSMRASERRMVALFRASPAALIMTRFEDAGVLEINEACERVFGMRREDAVGRRVPDLGFWESEAERERFVALLRNRGRIAGYRTRMRRRNGEVFEAMISAEHLPGEDGVQLLATVVDLSEEVRAREELRRSEERFRTAFDLSPIGMTITRVADGRYLALNRADHGTLGYLPEEVMGSTTLERAWLDPADRARFIAQLHAERRVSNYQARMRRKDGRIADCAIWASIVDIGGEAWVLASTINVTESKRVEDELRASRRLLEQVIDAIPMSIFAKDLGSNYVMANRYMAEFFGTTKAALLHHHTSELPSRAATREQSLRDDGWVFEQRRTLVHETWIQKSDGTAVPFHSSKIPLFDEYGEVTGLLGINRDITSEREAQRRIEEANASLEARVRERTAQLEAANSELEAFSYSVSHDLKAPLRAIDGAVGILRMKYGAQLPEGSEDYLVRISRGARQMAALIAGLLEFARLSKQTIERRAAHPDEIVGAVLQGNEEAIRERGVVLEVGALPSCEADPLLLRQVFENLIANALKYSVGSQPPAIEIGARRRGGEAAYYVRDNGVGFDMAYAGKLFGVFERLHAPGQFEGTGIGLALVRRIVERHGGRAWAESAPGRGATFYFTIPPALARMQAAGEERAHAMPIV